MKLFLTLKPLLIMENHEHSHLHLKDLIHETSEGQAQGVLAVVFLTFAFIGGIFGRGWFPVLLSIIGVVFSNIGYKDAKKGHGPKKVLLYIVIAGFIIFSLCTTLFVFKMIKKQKVKHQKYLELLEEEKRSKESQYVIPDSIKQDIDTSANSDSVVK